MSRQRYTEEFKIAAVKQVTARMAKRPREAAVLERIIVSLNELQRSSNGSCLFSVDNSQTINERRHFIRRQ